jgi:ceramide glucosyltransferase
MGKLEMATLLIIIGFAGILTSTVYLSLVGIAAVRFRRKPKNPREFTPPLSLLKPLHGAEPGLRDYLESFFKLDYPNYEILFCARHQDDAGLMIARELCEKYPQVAASVVTSGEPPWPNAKCYSLEKMKELARHDIFVITDSDVRVRQGYLRAVVQPFEKEGTGLVTCVYRGVAEKGGFWAKMEGLGMSVEMTSGVLVAEMLEGMKFALGPSMVVRKKCVEEIGGFRRLGEYLAEDFMLGNLIAENRYAVELSDHVIDHCIVNTKFRKSLEHQWNWMKSTRFSRPAGHLGTGLTFGLPFGLLVLIGALLAGQAALGFLAFAWTVLLRVLQSLVVGWFVVQDKQAVRMALLYPLRDLLGSVLWLASYASRKVGWRGHTYELEAQGLVRLIHAEHPPVTGHH